MRTPLTYYKEPQQKSCLQKYISMTSYFNLVISLIALAFAIYRSAKNSDVWNQSSFNWNAAVIGLLLIASILLLIASVVGILGSRKQNKCCLFLFHIFSMLLAVVFLTTGVVFVAVTAYASNDSNFNCDQSTNPQFYYAQQAYDLAQPLLCSNSCKCNLTNQSVISEIQSQDPLMLLNISQNGQTQTQGCQNYSNQFSNSDVSQEVTWLKFMEEAFQCTGLCTKPHNVNAFFFSDINSGVPVNDTCLIKFQDFLQSYGKLVYLIGLIVGFYLTFNAILSFCLCCKRKEQGLSFRERLAPY